MWYEPENLAYQHVSLVAHWLKQVHVKLYISHQYSVDLSKANLTSIDCILVEKEEQCIHIQVKYGITYLEVPRSCYEIFVNYYY